MKGSILKRGEKTYLLRISLGRDRVTGKRAYRTETYHGTRREAETKLRDMVRQFEQGSLVAKSSGTFNEFFEEWIGVARGRLRQRTYEDYLGIWERYLKEKMGRLPLDKITPRTIQAQYRGMIDRGLSPLTVRRLHTVLNQALRQAVRWKMLAHNPAADVDLPANRSSNVIRAMDLDQSQAFMAATASFRWGVVLRFALRTGMRPEEYLALQWSDINTDLCLATVRQVVVRHKGGGWKFDEPKTASSRRSVAIGPKDLEDLAAYRAQQLQERLFAGPRWKSEWDFVFTNEIGNPIYDGNLTKRTFKPALEAAGLSKTFRLYDLRHTHATLLLLAGEHPKVVSERLGHSSVSITLDTYSHVLPMMQTESARKIADLLTPRPRQVEAVGQLLSLPRRTP